MCESTRKKVWISQQGVQNPTVELGVEAVALEAGVKLKAGEAEKLRRA